MNLLRKKLILYQERLKLYQWRYNLLQNGERERERERERTFVCMKASFDSGTNYNNLFIY